MAQPYTPFKVLQRAEQFGNNGFEFSIVPYVQDGRHRLARSKYRYSSNDEIDTRHLEQPVEISVESYCPSIVPGLREADSKTQGTCYIKRPRLNCYDVERPLIIGKQVLREAQVCEGLGKAPHSNIAEYIGYQQAGNRITALCFTRYDESLASRVNPRHQNKQAFQIEERFQQRTSAWLKGIQEGLKHLHRGRLVHNDINPSNIMFREDGDIPIIIDFDSCLVVGEDLREIKRTFGWHDPNDEKSAPQNDWRALEEIKIWLSSRREKSYQFPGG